jgi:putative transposase
MRKEPFTVGDYVHVYNRGNRKQAIVRDTKDCWRFLQMLYYFNSSYSLPNLSREIHDLWKSDFHGQFLWPEEWPAKEPIVKVLNYSLSTDHFHLLLKEVREGGITMFMRKIGTGMTNYSNIKYHETGRLFQGAYKARLVNNDTYLKYLSVYIQVKNPFELYPGGLKKAAGEFNDAFDFAVSYPFCSLADYAGNRKSPIIDKDILGELFPTGKSYKEFARECVLGMKLEEELGEIIKGAE